MPSRPGSSIEESLPSELSWTLTFLYLTIYLILNISLNMRLQFPSIIK
jgi:hypothetical protein